MEYLTLGPSFDAQVPSIGINDPVQGATPGNPNQGIVNDPHVKLGNRTAYLKSDLDTFKTDNTNQVGSAIDNAYYYISKTAGQFYKQIAIPVYVSSPPVLNVRTLENNGYQTFPDGAGYRIMGGVLEIRKPRAHNRVNWEVTFDSSESHVDNKARIVVGYHLPGTSPYLWQIFDQLYDGNPMGHKTGNAIFEPDVTEAMSVKLYTSVLLRTGCVNGTYILINNVRLWTDHS
jgi:hypothetical protein